MSGGKQQQPTATTQTVQNYSPEETQRRLALQDEAARIYNEQKGKLGDYPGAKVVGMGADTKRSLDMGRKAADNANAYATQVQEASQFGLGDVLNVESNKYTKGWVDAAVRPITESYTDPGGVLSVIRAGGREAGQGGGTRQNLAEGIAAGKYAQAVGDTSAKMYGQAYEKGLDTYSKTLALAPGIQQMGTLGAAIQGQVGDTVESYEQEQENYEAAKRAWDLNKDWGPLANWANVIFGGSSPGTTTTQTGALPNQQGSRARSALGGAATGAAIGSVIPGWGTAVGAGLGLLLGLFQ